MTATAYRRSLEALPYGKRLPGAVYILDPGDDPRIPSLLRITVAELRKRLEIGPDFNLLKLHTASPKISFLAYPDFEKHPHPALAEAVIVDLVTGKTRRDDYRARETAAFAGGVIRHTWSGMQRPKSEKKRSQVKSSLATHQGSRPGIGLSPSATIPSCRSVRIYSSSLYEVTPTLPRR